MTFDDTRISLMTVLCTRLQQIEMLACQAMSRPIPDRLTLLRWRLHSPMPRFLFYFYDRAGFEPWIFHEFPTYDILVAEMTMP
jgi:hypothetical protein